MKSFFLFSIILVLAIRAGGYHSSYAASDYGLYRSRYAEQPAPTQNNSAEAPKPTEAQKEYKQNIVSIGDKPIGENTTSTETGTNYTNSSGNETGSEVGKDTITSTNENQANTNTDSGKNSTTSTTVSMSSVEKTVKVGNETTTKNETIIKTGSESKNSTSVADETKDDFQIVDSERESRKLEAPLKTEESTHHIQLDKIESKLTNSTVDYEVIREMLGTLVGPSKAAEILPKTDDDEKTMLQKTKRSVDPEKLVKRKLDDYELKFLFKSLKQASKKDLKKWKNRSRRSASNYFMNNDSPRSQLPELIVPPGASFTQVPATSSGGSYYVPAGTASQDSPVRSEGFRYAVRTAPCDTPSRTAFRSSSGSYAGSTPPVRSSSKYLTDLSDLPVSREFRGIATPEVRVKKTTPTAFRKVTVIETFLEPMSDESETRDFRTGYNTPSDEVQTFGRSLADSYVAENVAAGSSVPILMPNEAPIRISFDEGVIGNTRRYRRSPASMPKDISKRRVPMVLSTVSRSTRSGQNGPL